MTEARYDAEQVWTANPLNAFKTDSYVYTPDNLNRASLTSNGVTTNYGVSPLNQYSSLNGQGVEYDIRFNLYRINGWQYDHDAPNRLVSVTGNGHSASFTYDGLGRCVRRIVDGQTTLFVYDGWKPVTEYDAAGNLYARNIYGPGADEILMRGSPSGWFFYHADKQGSVNALVDLSGNVAERYKYDAFGQPKILSANNTQLSTSAVGNRFMFTGREYLAPLGLYDYRHRHYLPGLGRFLQTDPIGFDAGDMNLFRYCADDPVNRADPDGTTAIDSWKAQMLWQGSGDGTVSEQFIRMERLQAGMGDNAGGGAPSNSSGNEGKKQGSNQQNAAPLRFVPKPELTEDNRYYEYNYYQLTSGDKPVRGYNYFAQERTTVQANKFTGVAGGKVEVQTTDSARFSELPRSGLFKDRVGLGWQPSSRVSGQLILDQRFDLKYRGQPVQVSTVLRHVTEVNNGQVRNSVIVITP